MIVRFLLAFSACLLLSGCDLPWSRGSNTPTPPQPPSNPPTEQQPIIGTRRKEFYYFTSKHGDLEETRDHVTLIWAHCWGEPINSTRQLIAAQMPAIAEFRDYVFDGDSVRQDGEQLLRAAFEGYRAADVLRFIAKLYIDEPTQSAETLHQGTALVRKVMRDYPELASTRLMVCYGDEGSGIKKYDGMEWFDDIAFDAYGERAGVIDPGARVDRLRQRLLPYQRYYIVLGLNTGVATLTPDEVTRLADYALADPYCGGLEGYTWFDRKELGEDGSSGARSQPELQQACIVIGKRFIEHNLQENV